MKLMTILLFSANEAPGNGNATLIMLVLMFAIIYFFMIRPQSKKAKEQKQFKEQLKKGDEVVTIGGIYGKIAEIKSDRIVLEISKDVKVNITRDAISMDASVNVSKE